MTYYQHTTEEISAYFRITPEQTQKDLAKSMEIGKKHNGNIPAIFAELIENRDLSPIAKIIFAYSLGRTTKGYEKRAEMENIIREALQKGIEIGAQLPPGSSGEILLSHDKEGITIEIKPDETSAENNPGIAESTPKTSDPMYR